MVFWNYKLRFSPTQEAASVAFRNSSLTPAPTPSYASIKIATPPLGLYSNKNSWDLLAFYVLHLSSRRIDEPSSPVSQQRIPTRTSSPPPASHLQSRKHGHFVKPPVSVIRPGHVSSTDTWWTCRYTSWTWVASIFVFKIFWILDMGGHVSWRRRVRNHNFFLKKWVVFAKTEGCLKLGFGQALPHPQCSVFSHKRTPLKRNTSFCNDDSDSSPTIRRGLLPTTGLLPTVRRTHSCWFAHHEPRKSSDSSLGSLSWGRCRRSFRSVLLSLSCSLSLHEEATAFSFYNRAHFFCSNLDKTV